MTEKPGSPAAGEHPPGRRRKDAPEHPHEGERVGELAVQRMAKDDGRLLIAYWHSPPRS